MKFNLIIFPLVVDLLQGYENDLVNEDYLLSALDGVDIDCLPGEQLQSLLPLI